MTKRYKKIKTILLILLLPYFFLSNISISDIKNTINTVNALEQFDYTLKNGLKVKILKDKNRNYTSLGVIYNIGAEMELASESGLAHFFEHMTFHRTDGTHYLDVYKELGISANAFTSNYRTVYHAHFPNHLLGKALEIESFRMNTLDIDEKILEKEKNVVVEELQLRDESSLLNMMGTNMLDNFFTQNKGAIVGGYKQSVRDISLESVLHFYNMYYTPQNAEVFIIGNIDEKTTLTLIKKYFENIKKADIKTNIITQEYKFNDIAVDKTIILEKKEVPINKLYIGLEAPTIVSEDLKTNLSYILLNKVLLDGRSSILHKYFVKETKLALSVDAENYNFYEPFHTSLAKSYFDIVITINGNEKPAMIKDKLLNYIDKILLGDVKIDVTSLLHAKNKLVTSILDSIDYSGPIYELFYLHLALGRIGVKADNIDSLIDSIYSISTQDLQDALHNLFKDKTRIFGYVSKI